MTDVSTCIAVLSCCYRGNVAWIADSDWVGADFWFQTSEHSAGIGKIIIGAVLICGISSISTCYFSIVECIGNGDFSFILGSSDNAANDGVGLSSGNIFIICAPWDFQLAMIDQFSNKASCISAFVWSWYFACIMHIFYREAGRLGYIHRSSDSTCFFSCNGNCRIQTCKCVFTRFGVVGSWYDSATEIRCCDGTFNG